METLRITARRTDDGAVDFDAYDAGDLFQRATEHINSGRCAEGVVLYDRLAQEFPDSPYVSAALYNAGFCLGESGDFPAAVERYEALITELPDSPDIKHASLQVVELLLELGRAEEALEHTERLLARTDLVTDERMEAMARRGQAWLGAKRWDEAAQEARAALTYARTRPETDPVEATFFVAAANYVLAESMRERAQAMAFPPDGVEAQREVLLKRAELLLDAQREYFNTIRHTHPFWAAASGYRIGHMYDELWQSIMQAPVPSQLPEEGHATYRDELAKLVKPLIRHAIRYWELTLMMIERTGLKTDWTEQTQQDLERVRSLLLEQPLGPGGLDTPESP